MATPSIVSATSNCVAKKRQTMHHVSANPPFHPADNMYVLHVTIVNEKNINDYVLKSSIFFKDDVLLIAGSYKYASLYPIKENDQMTKYSICLNAQGAPARSRRRTPEASSPACHWRTRRRQPRNHVFLKPSRKSG